MKRFFLLCITSLILAFPLPAGHHDIGEETVSTHEEGETASVPSVEFQWRTSVLLDFGIIDPFVEVKGVFEGTEFHYQYRSFTLGTYLRAHKYLKVGAFYRLQGGYRHDDDWLSAESEWIDTRERLEHLIMLDATPRIQLPFLPGKNWVLMVKNRYIYNTYNSQHTIFVRPGLTYFLMPNRQPLLNFSIQYGIYFPLNFGDTVVYKHAPYLNILYHLGEMLKLELNAGYTTLYWSFPDEEPVDSSVFHVGLGVLITP